MSENINSSELEREIALIEEDLASKKKEYEIKMKSGEISELPHDKEILKNVIEEKSEILNDEPTPENESGVANEPDPIIDVPLYLSDQFKDFVQQLVNEAFNSSIYKSINKVKSTNNAALEKMFYILLTNDLYDKLVERGKLKKI